MLIRFIVTAFLLITEISFADNSSINPGNHQSYKSVVSLSQLEWQQRLILVKTNDIEKIKAILLQQDEAIIERNITWFILAGNELHSNNPQIDADQFIKEIEGILKSVKNDSFVLIGYDGEIKSTNNGLQMSRVFEQIDGMPIRRYEMSGQ